MQHIKTEIEINGKYQFPYYSSLLDNKHSRWLRTEPNVGYVLHICRVWFKRRIIFVINSQVAVEQTTNTCVGINRLTSGHIVTSMVFYCCMHKFLSNTVKVRTKNMIFFPRLVLKQKIRVKKMYLLSLVNRVISSKSYKNSRTQPQHL